MSEYMNKSILELHALLVSHQVTPLELVQDCISSLQQEKCNSLEATCFDKALLQASKIKEVKEEEILKGIPFVVKDNYSHKGVETTASSKILEGYVPIFDASVISKLKKQGMILVAHSTMDDLAMGASGMSGHKGITTNPYDRERIIGGSSCGSAALVAQGCVPFALGSDTGDSIRRPASYSNLVGLKPTWGRISRYGLFPFAPSMDTVSYLTRNVLDSAYMLSFLAGRDDKDMSSSTRRKEKYQNYILEGKRKYKVAYLKEMMDNIPTSDIKQELLSLFDQLRLKGYEIEEVSFDQKLLDAIYPTYMILSSAEAVSNDASLDGIRFGPNRSKRAKSYPEYMSDCRTLGFSDYIKERFILGSLALSKDYRKDLFEKACRIRSLIVKKMREFFANYDFMIMPSTFDVPTRIKDMTSKWAKNDNFLENLLVIANFGGFPSITLPFMEHENLPLGINITSDIFTEGYLFSIAYDIENITNRKDLVKEVEA